MRLIIKHILKYYPLHLVSLAFLAIASICGLMLPRFSSQIIDSFIEKGLLDTNALIWSIVLTFLSVLFSIARFYTLTYTSERIGYEVRKNLMTKIASLEYKEVNKIAIAKIITIFTNDVSEVKNFVGMGIDNLFGALLLLFGSVFLMFSIDVKLSLWVMIIVPILVIGFFIIFRNAIKLFQKAQESFDHINGVIEENIRASTLIRVFVAEKKEESKFNLVNNEQRNIGISILTFFSFLIPLVTFAGSLGSLIVLYVGGSEVVNGSLTIGELSAFNSYIGLFIFPIITLGFIASNIGRASATFQRIEQILVSKKNLKEGKLKLSDFKIIQMKNLEVTLKENKKGKNILRNIDLEIKKGQKIGIVGPTASGKSVLLHTLIRLYEPKKGSILIDGKDIKQFQIKTIRKQIAYIFQENILFNGTIMANLRFGNKTTSEKELLKVAKISLVDEFVRKFPKKYREIVGERGTTLSGGQKQRISIARALLRRPKILILDDSTSKLDTTTENKLLANLKKNYPDLTMIIISQKINSVKDCDQIYVLDEGEIESHGTHSQLVKNSFIYNEILVTQSNVSSTHSLIK